jgi:hypothetical protein
LAHAGLTLDQIEMAMFGTIGGTHRSQIEKSACHWANVGRVRHHEGMPCWFTPIGDRDGAWPVAHAGCEPLTVRDDLIEW